MRASAERGGLCVYPKMESLERLLLNWNRYRVFSLAIEKGKALHIGSKSGRNLSAALRSLTAQEKRELLDEVVMELRLAGAAACSQ